MNKKIEKQSLHNIVEVFYVHKRTESEIVMRKLMLTLMVLLLTLAIYGGSASGSTNEGKALSLGIIIDTSPCSREVWSQYQVAILEMASQLKRSDKITIYTAHPGKPRRRIIRVIAREGKYMAGDLVRETTSFTKEWLSMANLSRAVEFVFDDFHRDSGEYQHGLVVLSKGKLSSREVAQSIKLAVNFENNDWPIRFTCEKSQASRSLLVAANNQQLDVHMLDKPELTEWIAAARKKGKNEVAPATDIPTPIVIVTEDTKPIQDSDDGKSNAPNDETVKVEIVNLSKFPVGKPRVDDPNDNIDKQSTVVKKANLPKNKVWPGLKKSKWLLWIAALSGIVVVIISLYCIGKHISSQVSEEQIDVQEDLQQRLIGFVGQDRHDLGDITTLGEVVIGRGMGSSIFIEDENIEDKHIRIFRSGRKIKVQNLSTTAISIDGVQLNRKQKAEIFFPAEIELAGGVFLNLHEEDVNFIENERGNNNEE